MMNDHEVEKGLLKEKILTLKKCEQFDEQIKTDDNVERLKELYEYLQYREREKERVGQMSKTEYARHCKLEVDRSIRKLKKAGRSIDDATWKKYGMKMLLAISKVEDISKLFERHENVS